MHFMVAQGSEDNGLAEHDSQQGKMGTHAQSSNSEGLTAHPPSAQHPLASLLADFHYVPWQLEATPPQAPKVGNTSLR